MDDIVRIPTFGGLFLVGVIFLSFIMVLFILSAHLPGRKVVVSSDGEGAPRTYKLNGLTLYALVLVSAVSGQILGLFSLDSILSQFVDLFVLANIFAFTASTVLYVAGRKEARAVFGSGARGVQLAYYFGAIKNPRWLEVDLKFFSYRPSLIGLSLINISFAVLQFKTNNTLSNTMIAYQLFTSIYVFNYFQFERGMLFSWDLVSERFGWMLVWGDYVLVPFFYSLPGWFLIDDVDPIPNWSLMGMVLLFAFGFWMFRTANEQKHRFKQDPTVRIWGRPAKSIEGKLLVSGLWGIGRHLNYTGEICVYLAFALTTGFGSSIPYLLPIWLGLLLVHRSMRDERRCREKYGDLWDKYTQHARFCMIPFLY